MLASAGYDGVVRLWNALTHAPLDQLGESGGDSLEGLDFAPGGEVLATAGNSGLISIWDVAAKRLRGELRGHEGSARSVAFSPDSPLLASAGTDGTVRLWDVVDLKAIGRPLRGDPEQVTSVSFSPNGDMLASAGSQELWLWDPDGPGPAGRLPLTGPDSPLVVAFSPDPGTLASGNVGPVGGSVQLWDVQQRVPLGEPLRGHEETVDSVAFNDDGSILASAGNDGMVRLWDVNGRLPLGRALRAGPPGTTSVAFSEDGRVLATGGADGGVRLWQGILWRDLADLKALVCRLAVGNLNEAEWDELVPGLPYRTTCPG